MLEDMGTRWTSVAVDVISWSWSVGSVRNPKIPRRSSAVSRQIWMRRGKVGRKSNFEFKFKFEKREPDTDHVGICREEDAQIFEAHNKSIHHNTTHEHRIFSQETMDPPSSISNPNPCMNRNPKSKQYETKMVMERPMVLEMIAI